MVLWSKIPVALATEENFLPIPDSQSAVVMSNSYETDELETWRFARQTRI